MSSTTSEVHPVFISVFFLVVTCTAACILRSVAKQIRSGNLSRDILLEFIASLEYCAANFELIIVSDNWGIWAYALALFILTLWWGKAWETESACPYNLIEDNLEKRRALPNVILLIFVQTVAALLTFTYVRKLWDLELADTYIGRATEDCTADLQVNMYLGAVIEAIGTCMSRLFSRVVSECGFKSADVLSAAFSTMMVVAAFDYTGGYFNPSMASSLKLNCQGNTFVEHITVYWLGAIAGSVLSVYIYKSDVIQHRIRATSDKVE